VCSGRVEEVSLFLFVSAMDGSSDTPPFFYSLMHIDNFMMK
jgi:hypothetical protein